MKTYWLCDELLLHQIKRIEKRQISISIFILRWSVWGEKRHVYGITPTPRIQILPTGNSRSVWEEQKRHVYGITPSPCIQILPTGKPVCAPWLTWEIRTGIISDQTFSLLAWSVVFMQTRKKVHFPAHKQTMLPHIDRYRSFFLTD